MFRGSDFILLYFMLNFEGKRKRVNLVIQKKFTREHSQFRLVKDILADEKFHAVLFCSFCNGVFSK